MTTQEADCFRSESAHLELRDALRQPVSELLGVNAAAQAALNALGIHTVFDLGTAWMFANARAAAEAGKTGRMTSRFGIIPADLLKSSASWSSLDDIGGLSLDALRGMTNPVATQLQDALDVKTIREFALWPPYLVASRLVQNAAGSTIDDHQNPEAEALRPRFGEYPTERVYYSTLMMLQMHQDGQREALAGPISLKPAVKNKAGFNQVAIGAQLTFSQSWYAQGITLGHMLHSLALAPGEATRIAVIDWSRRTHASATEAITESEQLDNSTQHARALSEVQNAVANEFQKGGSSSQSSSTSSSSSFAATAGTGFVPSLWADVEASGGGQTASTEAQASSQSWSLGKRSVNASMTQTVNDRTEQHATSVRNRRASAVREVSQSEHEQVSTRVVANYNHMHALTVQYYEVVQVYRVVAQLHQAERCLFIPLELFTFDGPDALDTVERFRGALIAGALTRRARSLFSDDATTVAIRPAVDVKLPSQRLDVRLLSTSRAVQMARLDEALTPELKTLAGTRENGASSLQSAVLTHRVWDKSEIALTSRIVARPIVRTDSDALYFPDDAEVVGLVFDNLNVKSVRIDRTGTETPDNTFTVPTNSGRLDLPSGIPLIDIEAIFAAKADDAPRSGKVTLQLSYMGRRFNTPMIPVELSSGMNMQKVATLESDSADRRKEMLAHLKANHVHYSQAIFRALDTPTIVMLLSQFDWNGKALSEQVEPKPLSVVGNYLVLRAPVENDESSGVTEHKRELSWEKLLETRGIEFGETNSRLIPLPTAGVFAEAVLGRSNSAEKLDITRFWNWQDSPIPLQPTEIAPVATGSRGQAEDLKPGQLGQPVLNIVNPTSLPDPAGLAAVLNAVSNGNMFRDMSGLAGTQGLVQAGMSGTLQAATEAGQLASENMRTSAQKSVAMAQVAADIIKSVMGAKGGGGSVQGISGDGARINHGRDLDARGVSARNGGGAAGTSPGQAGGQAGGSGSVGEAATNGYGAPGAMTGGDGSGAGGSGFSREIAWGDQAALNYSPDALGAVAADYRPTDVPELVQAGFFDKDHLQSRSPKEVAEWYGRLADLVSGSITNSLASRMLKHWLGATGTKFTFDASEVSNEAFVIEHLRDEVRRVFLSEKKTSKGAVAGIVPRIQGKPGFPKWDGSSTVPMHYEGDSVSLPMTVHAMALIGKAKPHDIDLFMSLHSFGIRTNVVASLSPKGGAKFKVNFDSWESQAFDRYDWDTKKSLTVPNPDFNNPKGLPNPIAPGEEKLVVFHTNARRVEQAGLAAPYDVASTLWKPTDVAIVGPATVKA